MKSCTNLVNTCHACGHGNGLPTSERPKAEAPLAPPTPEKEVALRKQEEGVERVSEKTKKASVEPGRRFSFSAEPERSGSKSLLSGAQRLAQASSNAMEQSVGKSGKIVASAAKAGPRGGTPKGLKRGKGDTSFNTPNGEEGDSGKKKKKKTRKSGSGDDLLKGLNTPGGSKAPGAGSSLASFLGSL